MPLYYDQLNREVNLPQNPQRIISLVPSQTELLAHLGLEKEVIGITKFCVHPSHWLRNKTRIGGTKNIDIEKIKSLCPDLIIANKEENVEEQVNHLAQFFPVWVSDVNTLDDSLGMISSIGSLTGKEVKAMKLISEIKKNFAALPASPDKKINTAYLIWKEPYMTVGSDTFINDMLSRAGFHNVFKNRTRYPEISIAELKALNCELLLLSSEPYPFRSKHVSELKESLPQTKIILADGEMFSWYGSRLLLAPSYFTGLHQQIATFV